MQAKVWRAHGSTYMSGDVKCHHSEIWLTIWVHGGRITTQPPAADAPITRDLRTPRVGICQGYLSELFFGAIRLGSTKPFVWARRNLAPRASVLKEIIEAEGLCLIGTQRIPSHGI